MNIKKLAVLIMFLSLTGCAAVKNIVEKPEASFESVTVKDLSLEQETLLFKFRIDNPNPVGLRISSLSYNLMMNERKLSSGEATQGINLPASGSVMVNIPLTINHFDLFDSISQMQQTDSIKYALTGDIRLGPLKIPYEKTGELPVPRIPEIRLNRIEISSMNFTGAALKFIFDISNENDFEINISGLDYGLSLGGFNIMEGTAADLAPVPPRTKATLELPLSVNFMQLGRSVYNMVTSATADYRLNGRLRFAHGDKTRTVPFETTGKVPLEKSH